MFEFHIQTSNMCVYYDAMLVAKTEPEVNRGTPWFHFLFTQSNSTVLARLLVV